MLTERSGERGLVAPFPLVTGVSKTATIAGNNRPCVYSSVQVTNCAGDVRPFQQTQVSLLKGRAFLQAILTKPETAHLEAIKKQPDPIAWLQSHLIIDASPVWGVRISLRGVSVHDMTILVDSVTDLYVEHLSVPKEKWERRLRKLKSQLREIDEKDSVELGKERAKLWAEWHLLETAASQHMLASARGLIDEMQSLIEFEEAALQYKRAQLPRAREKFLKP